MYKYNKRNNQQEFSSQPASISSEISLCGNIANANFRPREISRVRIFAMAKFRGCEFSLWPNFAGANFRYGEISLEQIFAIPKFRQNEISLQLMRNFAKITAKFRLTQRKFASALTKIRSEISPNFRKKKERKTPNFVCISFAQYCSYHEIQDETLYMLQIKVKRLMRTKTA